uniref:FIP-RBD domain-containing protein n=1 Tax=Wuchereria bancrofti TaxID=6293 RepID=A0A1I8EXT7_WUCBA
GRYVISARGLSLKGHNKLEAFVNLTISGKGNWKSKVQTDIVRTTADCKWDQRCELYVFYFIISSSKLDTLKRKMRFGKKKNIDKSDATSILSLPQYSHRRSSLCEVCPTIPKSDHISIVDFNRDGLITPPVATKFATLPHNSKRTDGILFGSRRTSISSNRNSLNSSPVPIVGEIDGFDSSVIVSRPRSATSSGFGSARSTVINNSDLASISHCPSREELIKNVNDLRMELARKDAKINDLQDYIGKLLSRIMEKNPDMLEIKQSRGFFSRH